MDVKQRTSWRRGCIASACAALFVDRGQVTHEGATLSAAFLRSGLFPPLACLAIEVGEQSGRIAPALERVSGYYSARARERLDTAIAVIDPVLTLAVVGGTAVILVSFFQAAYQIIYATH